jgi:hypothetical protein
MVAEPLFQLGAEVEFHPVMSFDDLKKSNIRIEVVTISPIYLFKVFS